MKLNEIIDKWEKEADMWKKTYNENALFNTKEQKIKGAHYAAILTVVLKDLKEIEQPNSDGLLDKIREKLEYLEIHEWWDYGNFKEIRDKDSCANDILNEVEEHYL